MEERYLTVSALTKYIKYKFDNDRHLVEVLLTGEISNFKHHSRGHFYFTLKDESASIPVMMFSSNASKVMFKPKDGMKVFVKGTVTVYEAGGYYQIVVNSMQSDGIGDLYLAYEALKKELQEAGFFSDTHKLPLPRIPKTIGVITSPTGAAIKDIINTINRRYHHCQIILYPALVQGVDAKNSIVKQIKKANEDQLCDTLIVGRGGGSIEDLWAFNEKIVAMAIYESKIPIISAVGHEVDFTIADFVADKRAATPTAAAEIATPSLDVLKEYIFNNYNRLNTNIKIYLDNKKVLLGNIDKEIDKNNPLEKLSLKRRMIKEYSERLDIYINNLINYKKQNHNLLNEKLKALSPLNIMSKGYGVVKSDNKIIKSVNDIKKSDIINIDLIDGSVKACVEEINKNGK